MAKKAKTEIDIVISGDNASKKAFDSVEKSLDGMRKSTFPNTRLAVEH
jgi:hypothetical protein